MSRLCSQLCFWLLFFYFLTRPFTVLQDLWPWTQEEERVLQQHWSRGQSGGGARQHVQTAPQAQSPGDLRPAALPQEWKAAVVSQSLGRGRKNERHEAQEAQVTRLVCSLIFLRKKKSSLKHWESVISFWWHSLLCRSVSMFVSVYRR